MSEIVKFNTRLNELRFNKFTASDYDLFMVICAKLKEQGSEKKQIPYAELRKLAKFSQTNNADLYKSLQTKIRQLAETTVEIQYSQKHSAIMTLFSEFDNNGDAGILTVSVSERSLDLLNNLTANFTRFELEEFVQLKTKYQKSLYRNLKQFRSTGDLYISAEEFREKLDIPKSYPNKAIASKVIKPAVEALKGIIPDLETDLEKIVVHESKPGRPVKGYHFTFSKEAPDRQRTIDDWQNDLKNKRKTSKNKFNNIMQQDYNISSIESALLNIQDE